MNKLDVMRARAKLITQANERSEQKDRDASNASVAFARKLATNPTTNKLQQKQTIANTQVGFEMKEVPYSEIARIVAMPIILPMDNNEREEYNRANILGDAFEKGWRLFDIQAEANAAYDQYAGGFFPISVGFGKTLCTLMIANKAYAKGLKKILLLVPSQVLDQLITIDIKWARTKVPINLPIHIIGGREGSSRKALAASGKKGLYIMPHSYLSVKDTSEMLDGIKPELIIVDEAHNLANRSSARTKRLMHYVDLHKPEGVMLSGTITSKSIRDYIHLIKWALKSHNPLPNSMALANEWASVIDAQASGTYCTEENGKGGASGPLMPLIRWAQRSFTEQKFSEDIAGFRKAYKARLTTTPGVVSSGEMTVGTSLILANLPSEPKPEDEGWKKLEAIRSKITDEWLTPNGDEIEHQIHCWKWLYELSAGFYNELTWPTVDVFAKRKKITPDQSGDILEKSFKHHAAGQIYAKELRRWLEEKSKPGIDTPFLVGQSMSQHGARDVTAELYELWQDWKHLDFDGRPDRDSRSIRVCSYKIDAAVKWAKALEPNTGALMWVWHQEAGEWLHEELVKAGVENALHCPAGDAHNAAIIDPENANRVVVASMSAHGTGKNLQHFQHNYFLQWPRQAVMAEQTLGRTHRMGQKADELVVNTNLTSEFDQLNFAACLNDSLYIHQTTGNRQKLIYANYNPLPKIFPSAVLLERGMQNKLLNHEQQEMMKERFSQ